MLFGHTKNLKALAELAKTGSLGHGFIFYGPDMVGKFSAAKSLAAYLEKGDWDAEGLLEEAKVIIPNEEGNIGIDESRAVKEFVYQKPSFSKYRVVIIDESDKFTDAAQDALLKIAEEPPESSLLILIVRDPELLSPTLRSRFQKIYFAEGTPEELEEYLKKEKKFPAAEAKKLAALSGGKAGLAIRLKDDIGFKERLETAGKYLAGSAQARTDLVKSMQEDEGWDVTRFLDDLALVYVAKNGKSPSFAQGFHAIMETRQNFGYYNLSPRIQLEALSQKLNG